jgi:hypothetical protein
MILSSTDDGLSRRTRRAHNQFSEFIKGPSTSQPQRTSTVLLEPPPAPTISNKVSNKKRGKQKATAAELEPSDALTISTASAPAPRKRRKTITNSATNTLTETISSTQPILDPSESTTVQSRRQTTRSSRRHAGSTTIVPTPPGPPSKPRKVILRVTQPEDALDRLLQDSSEPLLVEKRAEFRRNGWYLPLDRNGERRREPPEEPGRSVGTWDVILKGVEAAYRPAPLYLAVTGKICEAIKARAELSIHGQVTQGRLVRGTAKGKGPKKQRDDPETVWRKKLAKVTLELVVDQWKRVVLVSVVRIF